MIAATGSLNELRSLAAADGPERAARVAREFEALVITEMLKSASKPIAGESLLDGGSAGRMAREQFQAELAMSAVRAGGLGLAKAMQAQMQATGEAVEGRETGS